MTRQRLPSAGSLGRLSRLPRYYALLRLLAARPASPQLSFGSTVLPEKNRRKRRDLPGSWVTLCTYAALYDPGRIFVPSHEDDTTRGVAVDRRLSPATSVAVGASVRTVSLSRRLAARRYCPRSSKRRGLQLHVRFRGSITRPQRSLSTLRRPPHDGPRKTRLQLVANLCCAGLVTRRGTFKVSAFHRFLLGQAFLAQFEFKLGFGERKGCEDHAVCISSSGVGPSRYRGERLGCLARARG